MDLAKKIAEKFKLKVNVSLSILNKLAALASEELKTNGEFTFPGFVKVKTRVKPATKGHSRKINGQMREVKSKPARTVIRAVPVAAFKRLISATGHCVKVC